MHNHPYLSIFTSGIIRKLGFFQWTSRGRRTGWTPVSFRPKSPCGRHSELLVYLREIKPCWQKYATPTRQFWRCPTVSFLLARTQFLQMHQKSQGRNFPTTTENIDPLTSKTCEQSFTFCEYLTRTNDELCYMRHFSVWGWSLATLPV